MLTNESFGNTWKVFPKYLLNSKSVY